MINEWIDQCRQGQTRAYAHVVKALQQPILDFLFRMTQDRHWAEDLGQEVFLRAYRQMSQYDERRGKFSTWLFSIARNLCLDELRKRRMHWVSWDDTPERMTVSSENPFGLAQDNELEQLIRQAISELEMEFREVFILREYENLSLDEIAMITKTPLGTVKSRLHRARLQLQEKLAPILNA